MKRFLLACIAIPALAAAPAAAQYAQTDVNAGGAAGIGHRIAQLEARLDAGVRQGEIDRQEERSLRQQIYQLRQTERL